MLTMALEAAQAPADSETVFPVGRFLTQTVSAVVGPTSPGAQPSTPPTITKETVIQREVTVVDKAAQRRLYTTAGIVGAFVVVTGTIAAIAASRANRR